MADQYIEKEEPVEMTQEEKEYLDRKEKELQENIKKYEQWLADNGVNDETRPEFTTSVSHEKVILYRQVAVFMIPQMEDPEQE